MPIPYDTDPGPFGRNAASGGPVWGWAVPPLVVDFNALSPLGGALDDLSQTPINRLALDRLRLQRRFRGRILLLAYEPAEFAWWLAHVLDLDRMVDALPRGRSFRDRAVDRFGRGGFEFLGNPQSVVAVGPCARRIWMIGGNVAVKDAMRTRGVPLVLLDPSETVVAKDLVAASNDQGWVADTDWDRVETAMRRDAG